MDRYDSKCPNCDDSPGLTPCPICSEEPDPRIKAMALISSIANAMLEGVPHYDAEGRPLRSVGEVLEALKRDKKVHVGKPPR